jgi:hypothetical protein
MIERARCASCLPVLLQSTRHWGETSTQGIPTRRSSLGYALFGLSGQLNCTGIHEPAPVGRPVHASNARPILELQAFHEPGVR